MLLILKGSEVVSFRKVFFSGQMSNIVVYFGVGILHMARSIIKCLCFLIVI